MMSSSKSDNHDVFSTGVVSGEYNSSSDSSREQTAVSQPKGLIGSMLQGRYRLLEVIDQGGMGQILRAIQEPMGREVAIKIMKAPQEQDAEKRFFREAALTSKLQHPNTVRIYDYGKEGAGTEDELIFIAMELLRGRSLREEIREGPVEPLRCVRIYKQVCGALGEAHQQGIIHRDIKPSNIFMTAEEVNFPKLLDFGLVKDMDGESTELTKTGMVLGSPMYMSPEQVKSEKVSASSDIYSLGMSMYHTLSGCTPFEGEFTAIMMAQILKMPEKIDVRMQSLFRNNETSIGEPISPSDREKAQKNNAQNNSENQGTISLPFDIPEIIEWVIFTAIEKEPENRFVSISQFRQALEICEEVLIKRTDNPEYNLTLSLQNGVLVRSDGKSLMDAEISKTMVFTPNNISKTKNTSETQSSNTSKMIGLGFVLGIIGIGWFLWSQQDAPELTNKEAEKPQEIQISQEIQPSQNKEESQDSNFEVRISSTPEGATIMMTNKNNEKLVVGSTPFVATMDVLNMKFLEIEKKGYRTQKILPSSSNTEFRIVLEAEKKTYKKRTRSKNTEQQSHAEQPETQPQNTSDSKKSGELKDPW